MDEHDKAGDPQEQAAETKRQRELGHGKNGEDWPDPLREPYELTHDELDMLRSQVPGHRWNAWRRLTGDEDYYAACSCGWRSTETGSVSPVLVQVKDHLDAVWAIRGGRTATGTTRAPAFDEGEHDAIQREMRPGERARELYVAVQNQQERLSQTLERSTDLLSASEEQADRLVAALEHTAVRIAPEWARTPASARSAETLQRRLQRTRELRTEIIAAAAAVAAIAEEAVLVHQDLKTRRPGGSAEHQRRADQASKPAGKASQFPGAGAAGQAERDQDLLDQVVNRLFQAGLSLQSAADLPHEVAIQAIADVLQRLDDTIREIRDHVFGARDGGLSSDSASRRPLR